MLFDKSKSVQITLCLKLMINKAEDETDTSDELLVTEEFERLLFVTLFVPFIKQTTPSRVELKLARKRFLPDAIRPNRSIRTPVSFRSYQPPRTGRLGSPGRSHRLTSAGRYNKRRKEKLMRNSLDYHHKNK